MPETPYIFNAPAPGLVHSIFRHDVPVSCNLKSGGASVLKVALAPADASCLSVGIFIKDHCLRTGASVSVSG